MYDTAEVRWILPGAMPAPIARWFRPRGLCQSHDIEPETRTDRYVVIPGSDSVGIKLRGTDGDDPPRLDVKARLGEATELCLAPGIAGQAAAWSKWTLGLVGPGAIISGLEPPAPVLDVHKSRVVRRRRVEGNRTREIPNDEAVDDGCEIELCSIFLDGIEGPWWSLGLEAFGPRDRVWKTLSTVGRSWFEDHGAPPLQAGTRLDGQTSCAYPAWLTRRLIEAWHGDR